MRHKQTLSARALAASLACLMLSGSIANANPVTRFLQEQQEQPKQPQIQKLPPRNYVRSRDYDMKHVALDLKFDWDKSQAYGTATLTLAPFKTGLTQITLDEGKLSVNSVKVLGSNAALKFTTDDEKQKLYITPDRSYKAGEDLTLVIDYRTGGAVEGGILGGFGGGIRFIKPTPDNPKKPRQIWSQGESEFNRFWFPSYDSPNDFATSELRATVEKPFVVISNGKLLETKDNKDNTRTFHWKIDSPHANYLTSIVVGEYAEVSKGSAAGKPVSSYVYPNEAKEGGVTTVRLPKMVQFFSDKTGVPYPYEKYAQTMVEDFGGGMENISATTQIEGMIHDEREELDETSDSLQSHELAHQWFGDYVTCREWGQIWLNESFATYFQAMWDEESIGHDEFLYRDVRSNQQQYLSTWNRGNRRPVVTQNYTDRDAIFDSYAYPRGGATLHMLRTFVGEENWWKAINHYLTVNAHKPVSTEQLRIAFEETTGQSLDRFFDQWLYKMGHPIFEITQSYDEAGKKLTLTVKQTQKPDPTYEYPQVEFFETPVDVEIGTASGARVERVMIEPQETTVLTFNVDSKPNLVNFDYQGTLIKEMTFQKPVDDLVFQLGNDKDMLGRLWALSELGKLSKAQTTAEADKAKISAALNKSMTSDAFWAVRREAVRQFAAPQQNQMAAFFGTAPTPHYAPETVMALKAATKDKEAATRAAAFDVLGALKDSSNAELFAAALSDRSYNVVDQASDALAQTKSPQAYERLVKLLDEQSWRDRVRIAGLNSLATLGDKRAFDTGLKYAGDTTQSRGVRSAALAIVAATGKGDARAYPLVFEGFKKSLDANDFQSIFTGITSIIRLADPRGQEAFDLMKAKFGKNQQIMGFVTQLETQFQTAIASTAK